MTKYFAYIDGLRGPEPQIWFDVYDSQGSLKPHLLLLKISYSDQRSIDELKKEYAIETI